MKQRIITRKAAKSTTSWTDIEIPAGWIVKQISTSSIAKSISSNNPDTIVITALIEQAVD